MTTVLIANRGEIARRIIRTARRMGFRAVAAHSEADRDAPFVREADAAIELGPAAPAESYLSIPRIVAAAREAKADLVHPGYGFLAEDASFARAIDAAGMRFVGPPADVLDALGDKAAAKTLAEGADVPVLPGYREEDQRDEAFLAAAARVGYPVMVKPTAGGGGIGMRLVRDEPGLRDALASARRAALAAFGDERLLIERAVERPRHVEVQILADAHGTILALGERDCSAQRRHQKVLEETPAPGLDARRRKAMADAAVRLASAAGYVNAGTVEFVVDERGDFFFLEVNARLQVEHPVTELVWDLDLVESQLRVALGERLAPIGRPSGHAVEARIYAEDPSSGFLPASGRVVHLRWPEGVRVDAGIEEGSTVTAHYDPLLAKLVAHGRDRADALERLARALAETTVLGIRTNLGFLRALVAEPAVREGRVDTGLIEREIARLAPPAIPPPPDVLAVAAAAVLDETRQARRRGDPWSTLGPWRAGGAPITLSLGANVVRVDDTDPYLIDGRTVARADERSRWLVDGTTTVAARDGEVVWVEWRGTTYEVSLIEPERTLDVVATTEIVAPMPGQVIAVHARTGQRVVRGDLLALVEAMKMELRVEAPGAGTVRAMLCAVGDQVKRGQRLVDFEPDAR